MANTQFPAGLRAVAESIIILLWMVRTSAGEQSAVIADTGWNNWQQWTIRDVEVKDGKATIGIDMVGNAGNWGSIDDVEFYLQE